MTRIDPKPRSGWGVARSSFLRHFEALFSMNQSPIAVNTRKCLCNHIGDMAGNELADLILHLASRVEELERSKVDVTPIIPASLSASPACSMLTG